MKIKEIVKSALTVLNVISFLEFLGIMGFIMMLVYYGLQNAKIIALPYFTANSLSVATTMAILLFIFIIGFVASNPQQDRLDKAQMDEWRKERKKEQIAWREAHPMVA